ncbi:MAG: acyl-CoA/acyl-ACP dehydrogenase [SAR324 cluster bacterium]|nr:acyl-CoA/acyl-ACP dehydrogenase [SAR324 cluster bacterium]
MALVLTEEQSLLKETANEFLQKNAPITEFRKLRDEGNADGFSRELWQEMANLGWTGILVPEKFGGLDFGYPGLGVILEETGRTLAPTPLVSTVLLGCSAIQLGGIPAQCEEFLPTIAKGNCLMALAFEEGAHHAPNRIVTNAKKTSNGFQIDGEKVLVLDGHVADHLIVAARTSGAADESDGITLFLVKGDAPGMNRTRTAMVDSRNSAIVRFNGVEVGKEAVIGEVDQGYRILEQVLDRGRIGLSAEMLGSTQEVFGRTIAYLKERKQFDVPIGSFQALKHRAAWMFCDIELSISVVLDALSAIDERPEDVPAMASLTKARLSDTFFHVSNEAIQMHGGIGMTDEADMGFFLKRARVTQHLFGDAPYHRNRYALLGGY